VYGCSVWVDSDGLSLTCHFCLHSAPFGCPLSHVFWEMFLLALKGFFVVVAVALELIDWGMLETTFLLFLS